MTDRNVLLSFGHGYSAQALARRLVARGWKVIGTTRSADKARGFEADGVEPVLSLSDAADRLGEATHILISAGPTETGDPVLSECGPEIAEAASGLAWAGYLSTTGVYGDRAGGWVDETSECRPATRRGQWRQAAEQAWSSVPGLPLHIFRLAGIYARGAGR